MENCRQLISKMVRNINWISIWINWICFPNITFNVPKENETNGNGKRSNAVPDNYINAYEN